MYEKNLKMVREKALDAILAEMTYEKDVVCHHDDFTICPDTMCRVLKLFNIYPMDLMERIRNFKSIGDEENPHYSFRKYWESFVNQIILDSNDFQVWIGDEK